MAPNLPLRTKPQGRYKNASTLITTSPNTQSRRSLNLSVLFPLKLHQLLEDVEKEGNENIVSWMPGGKTFKVHNKEKFETLIMPRYFGSSKYRSFQKNLNLWQYTTLATASSSNLNRGEITHPLFVRGEPELCQEMKRIVRSNNKNDSKSANTNENNNSKTEKPAEIGGQPPSLGDAAPATTTAAGVNNGGVFPVPTSTTPFSCARFSTTPTKREGDSFAGCRGERTVNNAFCSSTTDRPLISQLRKRMSISSEQQQQQQQQHLLFRTQHIQQFPGAPNEPRGAQTGERISTAATSRNVAGVTPNQREQQQQPSTTSDELESLLELSQLLLSSSSSQAYHSSSLPSVHHYSNNSGQSSVIDLLSSLIEQRQMLENRNVALRGTNQNHPTARNGDNPGKISVLPRDARHTEQEKDRYSNFITTHAGSLLEQDRSFLRKTINTEQLSRAQENLHLLRRGGLISHSVDPFLLSLLLSHIDITMPRQDEQRQGSHHAAAVGGSVANVVNAPNHRESEVLPASPPLLGFQRQEQEQDSQSSLFGASSTFGQITAERLLLQNARMSYQSRLSIIVDLLDQIQKKRRSSPS